MILEIPYLYQAEVLLPRKKLYETVAVRARVPVKIAQVAESDAPLAAVYEQPDEGAAQRLPYRAHGGGLVAPWLTLAEVEGKLARDPWWPTPFGRRAWTDKRPETVLDDGAEVREWLRDDRLAVADAIVRASAALVAIGGVLWTQSHGPVWQVLPHTHHHARPVEVRAASANDASVWMAPLEYRADRLADALAHARLLAAAREDGVRDVLVTRNIVVRRPDAFTLDDDWRAVRRTAAAVVGENRNIAGWPRAAAAAWYELRDRLTLPKEEGGADPATVDLAVLDAAQAFVSAIDAHGANRLYLNNHNHLKAALERFERGRTPAAAPGQVPPAPAPQPR